MTREPPPLDQYIVLVPRGLQTIVLNRIRQDLGPYQTRVEIVGETNLPTPTQCRQVVQQQTGKKRSRIMQTISATIVNGAVVGTTSLNRKDVSVGYCNAHQEVVWSTIGETMGQVWLYIATRAPPTVMGSLRYIGPLIALIQLYKYEISLQELQQTVQQIQEAIQSQMYPFDQALQLWRKHVHNVWPNPSIAAQKQQLSYRLSCMRSDDETNFARHELVHQLASTVCPYHSSWKVDLTAFDVEIVLLLRSHAWLVGIALRPYSYYQTKGFRAGTVPTDVTPPYVVCSSKGFVRLRPTTAQILLHLAQIQPGDVVLDPCAGIGTIPMEACQYRGVAGFGGDVVLTEQGLGELAATYAQMSKPKQATLVAWDGAILPVRTSSIDAIVSDLPFGQQCLSSTKLLQLLPLMIAEMARTLIPEIGRMVLLCGSYVPVLNAVQETNSREKVWKLPCQAVFPVNIGGLQAWIIQVQRGPGSFEGIANQRKRLQKLATKRLRVNNLNKNQNATSTRHIQA